MDSGFELSTGFSMLLQKKENFIYVLHVALTTTPLFFPLSLSTFSFAYFEQRIISMHIYDTMLPPGKSSILKHDNNTIL